MEKEIVKASIITIGDELMIGQVIDTNSAFIAQQLNKQGIWIRRRAAVGDDRDEIKNALDEESKYSQIILITGGLGPTADDITKPLLCEYFGMKLVRSEKVLQHVTHLFEKIYRRPLTAINMKQADVPDGCIVIDNPRGTAPGMWFEKNGVIYVSMPGVPFEMQGMMTESVIPMLTKKVVSGIIKHKTLLTAGIGESALAEHINAWEVALPAHLKLAYLPSYGMVRLRITGTGSDDAALEKEMESYFTTLQQRVSDWLVSTGDVSLVQTVSGMLRDKKKRIGTAESCTGGYIAHMITSEPGSSAIFNGSVVSYANRVKMDVLNVNEQTLIDFGAVSEETVKKMVKGALKLLEVDYCIATSGIMGPDGGTPEKPVGTVWIAVGNEDRIMTQKFSFRFNRSKNIEMAAMQALNLLRGYLIEN